MKTTMKYFISYSNKDENWATWIAGVLEEQGQKVLIQAWDIRAGDNFISMMHEFFRECDVIIPVLSWAYLDSAYCEAEWTNAFGLAVKDKRKRFIPVRVAEVKPDGLLYARVYIDLFDLRDEKAAEKKLIDELILEDKPRQKTAFPNAPSKLTPSFPGVFPPNNLPQRSRYFSGRKSVLQKVYDQFRTIGGTVCLKQTITGMGGVGKTQTALEYAYRFGHTYKDQFGFHDKRGEEVRQKGQTPAGSGVG